MPLAEAHDDTEEAFCTFVEENKKAWLRDREEESGKRKTDGGKRILVEGLVDHSGYMLFNGVIAGHVMSLLNASATALLLRDDANAEALFRSYGVDSVRHLRERDARFFSEVLRGLRVVRMLRCTKGMDDILALQMNGVYLGKIAYDTLLRVTGRGTVDKLSMLMFSLLVDGLGYQHYIEELFAQSTFDAVVQSENQFIPSAILWQVALQNNVTVLCREGLPSGFTVRRYDSAAEAYVNKLRFDSELLEYVHTAVGEMPELRGRDAIEKRFSLALDDTLPEQERNDGGNAEVLSRNDICERFGWDASRSIIVVMSHMLIDGVFTDRWSLFRDNFLWLRRTLEAIVDIRDVNWIVRGHPADIHYHYDPRTTVEGECDRVASRYAHVRFLSGSVSSNCLPGIVDAVLTTHGTAGLEYPCLGIPCVLGGESFYSGLGFTEEPESEDAYYADLKRMGTLPRLSSRDTRKAREYAYIYLVLSRVPSCLLPDFSPYKDYDEKRLWGDTTERLQKTTPGRDRLRKMLRIQLRDHHRHLLNYDWVGLNPSSPPPQGTEHNRKGEST